MKTILVVEDQESHAILLGWRLENEGYDVLYATNVEDALKIIKEEKDKISLVFLDIKLPKSKEGLEIDEGGGFKIAEEIPKSIPFIFTTVYERDDDYSRGIELGAKAFFTKPFDTRDVANKIIEIIGKNE
ncbi:TPA: hypothetical protein DCX16_04410 [bacterium]|nr:hypothetical protein [bacterium]